jgi:hypothetical protein
VLWKELDEGIMPPNNGTAGAAGCAAAKGLELSGVRADGGLMADEPAEVGEATLPPTEEPGVPMGKAWLAGDADAWCEPGALGAEVEDGAED